MPAQNPLRRAAWGRYVELELGDLSNRVVDLYENQHRLLKALRDAGDRPVSVDDLDAAGVINPATTVYELQLTGHPIERVYDRETQRFAGFQIPRVARERLEAQERQPPPPPPRKFSVPAWLERLNGRRASAS